MSFLKTCGVMNTEDIKIVNKYLPDFVDFIFTGKKRKVSFDQAKLLKTKLNRKIKTVGVFANESMVNIISLANKNIIDFVQLQGDEHSGYINQLKTLISIPVIKAITFDDDTDINNLNYKADYLLINKKDADNSVNDFVKYCKKKYFLTGDITESNILPALRMNPYCINVDDGVLTDGLIDEQKLKTIMNIIKNGT
ncbi:MAG: hypothetical protein LBV22_02145 [Mycoplasmataceae bacterium]|jgi:phosphoribosylanthranilate isomerase|nr:hypothetical protein [Mycoplasmataceae bacterium]